MLSKKFKSIKNKYYCDSLFFFYFISIFYGSTIYKPGSSLKSLAIKKLKRNDALYIFSKTTNKALNYLVAPKFTEDNDYEIFANQIFNFIKNNNLKIKYIYLGISSPKQNLLANHILKIKNDHVIFCIGAILDDIIDNDFREFRKGTEWILRFFKKPRRSINKFYMYFIILLKIFLVDKSLLNEFYQKKLKN